MVLETGFALKGDVSSLYTGGAVGASLRCDRRPDYEALQQ